MSYKIDASIKELESYKNLINSRKANLEEGSHAVLYQPYIGKIKDRYVITSVDFLSNTKHIPATVYTELWEKSEKLGIAYGYSAGYIISQNAFKKREYNMISRVFFKLVDDDKAKADQVLPGGTYIINYGIGHYGDTKRIYEQIYDYLDKYRLIINGDVSEEYITDELVAENPSEYIIKISIPIKN